MQSCTEQCAYKCTLDSCPSGFVCEKEECSGKYCKSGCQPGYNWNAATQSCTSQCSSSQWYSESTGQCCSNSYQYDESNCPLSGNYHCSMNTCGGKYTDCKVKTTTNTVESQGVYFATSKEYCPGIKDFTASYIYQRSSIRRDYCFLEKINNGQIIVEGGCLKGEKVFYQCVDADEDCYNFYNQVRNAHDGEIININKDMYCGNLTIFTPAQNVVINGNGHTLSFEKKQLTFGYNDFWVYNNSNLALKNLKIDSSRAYGLNVLANSFCEGISSDSRQIFGSSSYIGWGIDLDNVSVNAGLPRGSRGRSLGIAVISGPVILGEDIYDDYNNPTYYKVIMNGGSITVE